MNEKLSADLKYLFSEGYNSVHVLADFDGTLTKEYVDGKKVPSIISVLRDMPGLLPQKYQEAARALYEKYMPMHRSQDLSLKEMKEKMLEWWEKHFQLLIETGITKDHIRRVAESGIIQLRDGAADFLKRTRELGIPVVIMSAAGLGEAIPLFLKNIGINTENIYFITNSFIWDGSGKAVDFHKPVIHSYNKDETVIRDFPDIYQKIHERKRVLLLGNNPGDLEMVTGFEAEKVLSIAFLDEEEVSKRLEELAAGFDHVVVGGFEKIAI